MKILHLLTSGNIGGIEILCKDIGRFSKQENAFCFLFGEGKVYEQMLALGQNVFSLFDNKKISKDKLVKLIDIAEGFNIIVVHHDDPFLELYYLLLKKRFQNKKKFISTVHHCYDPAGDKQQYGLFKRLLKKYIVKKMFKFSDQIIFVSNAGCKSYETTYKIAPEKVKIVYNGIGQEKLEGGLLTVKDTSKKIRLLYAGRLVKLKGVSQLLYAVKELVDKYPICLVVVGDGPERNALEQLVKEFSIADYVRFEGFQDDVRPYLANSDIFVYPSKTEIFGISVIEAMAYRNICVASNVGGLPEIIVDGYNGFLNKNNSNKGLVEKIEMAIHVLHNSDERERIRDNAQKTAKLFSISKTISDLEKIYQIVIEEDQ